jgi:PAS domain S-box-containing protein
MTGQLLDEANLNKPDLSYAELRTLLSFLPLTVDGTARFLYPLNMESEESFVDAAVYDLLGNTPGTDLVSYLRLPGIILATDLPEFEQALATCAASDKAEVFCKLRISVDGSYHRYLVRMVKQQGKGTDWIYGELSRREENLPFAAFEQFLNSMAQPVSMIDEQGQVVIWNDAMANKSGVTADIAKTIPIWDLLIQTSVIGNWDVNDADVLRARILEVVNQAIAGKQASFTRSGIVTDDGGNMIYSEQVIIPMQFGDRTMLLTIVHNVTAQKEAELALTESEANLRGILERANAIFWKGNWQEDGSFSYYYVSPQVARLGYNPDDWIADSNNWMDNVLPADRQMVIDTCQTATREMRDHEFEYRIQSVDGQIFWLRDIVRVVPEAGRAKELVGIMVDITLQKQSQRILQIKLGLARRLSRITDSEKALEPSIEAIIDVCEADGGCFYLFDQNRTATVRNLPIDDLLAHSAELNDYLHAIKADGNLDSKPLHLQARELPQLMDYGVASLYALPIRSNSGGIIGCAIVTSASVDNFSDFIVASAQSFTDSVGESLARMNSETALIHTLTEYRLLFENIQEGVTFCTIVRNAEGVATDYTIDLVNAAFIVQIGLTEEMIVGRTARSLYQSIGDTQAISLPHLALCERVARGEQVAPFEMRFNERDYLIAAYATEPDKFALTFSDITEQKRAQEVQLAQAVLASREAMLRHLAHDLKAPISAITTYTGLIEMIAAKEEWDLATRLEKIREKSNFIQVIAFRMSEMMMRMMEYSSLSQQSELQLRPADLSRILSQLHITELSQLALAKQQDLILEVVDKVETLADASLIDRAITNLVNNAIHYTSEGGRIVVRLEKVGDNVVVSVADNGIGIAPENLAKIFDPFFRAEGKISESGNVGLGLAMVQKIAILHGGQVKVDSELGRGSVFTIILPIVN